MGANPEYEDDDQVYKFADFGFIGFDLWQVKAGAIFDNVIVTDDLKEADVFAKKWKDLSEVEKAKKKEEDDSKKVADDKKDEKDDDDDDEEEDRRRPRTCEMWIGWGDCRFRVAALAFVLRVSVIAGIVQINFRNCTFVHCKNQNAFEVMFPNKK